MWVVATVLLEHIQTEKVIVPRKYVSTEKRKITTTEQVLMNVLDIEKKAGGAIRRLFFDRNNN